MCFYPYFVEGFYFEFYVMIFQSVIHIFEGVWEKDSSISEDEKRKDSENHKKQNKYLLINVEKRKFAP